LRSEMMSMLNGSGLGYKSNMSGIEGKCGASVTAQKAKEGKCGASKKVESKAAEGKCGEGACGNKK
ncbi:MAG: hypothetical protein Q4A74_07600, partial [Cardiobacteriaceae bacterium]|nr:hypothetical protein [Cardiobacteriaceae bacterium]